MSKDIGYACNTERGYKRHVSINLRSSSGANELQRTDTVFLSKALQQ